MECQVCCEALKKPIQCKICDYVACYKCFSRFMIDCTVNPKCMKCEKPWTRKHLVDSFGQYFVTHKYKKKREDVLFDIEKAMLPDTLPIAIRERKVKVFRQDIAKHESEIYKLRSVISRLETGILDSEFEEFLEARKNLRMQIHDHDEEIIKINARLNRLLQRSTTLEKKANFSVVVKCPNSDCRGYVNNRNMSCELCETKICRECHEILDNTSEHTCNPETVETVKLLKKDSKNCPSCKSLIYKIDGCDQMFCTQCHTAFSWRTGEISHGRIHNPHYYEYLRRTGGEQRELGDIPCGGLPRATRFIIASNFLRKIHNVTSHIEMFEIPRLNDDVNIVNGNLWLRVHYLNNEISLHGFKNDIYKKEKALEKKREILTVLNTFVVVSSDIFRRIISEQKEDEHKVEFESIRAYTNEALAEVSRVYKCVVPSITQYWDLNTYRNGDVPVL